MKQKALSSGFFGDQAGSGGRIAVWPKKSDLFLDLGVAVRAADQGFSRADWAGSASLERRSPRAG